MILTFENCFRVSTSYHPWPQIVHYFLFCQVAAVRLCLKCEKHPFHQDCLRSWTQRKAVLLLLFILHQSELKLETSGSSDMCVPVIQYNSSFIFWLQLYNYYSTCYLSNFCVVIRCRPKPAFLQCEINLTSVVGYLLSPWCFFNLLLLWWISSSFLTVALIIALKK